jgi:uncharacterized protein YbjT (DUF2867 family)
MILITGGTGTSGGEIAQQLAATGTRFRAMARNPQKAGSLQKPGIEVVAGDLSHPESLKAALAGVDRLLMLSPPTPHQVEMETNLLNAARTAGVRHIVKFSAMTADANSPSRFPRAHGQVERLIQSSGLAWTFLRPTFFMQNLLGLAGMIRQGTIYQPAADARAAFVDTQDIAAVAVQALTGQGHEAKAYEITGPQLLSYHDVARIVSQVTGHPVRYQDIPPAAARQAMIGMGMPEWNADGINELMDQMRAGAYEKLTPVVQDVGKKRPTSLEQFARDNIETWNAPAPG